MEYRGEYTSEISFPLGAIGGGCIGLSGNGRLVDWEIFNSSNKNSLNGISHFAVRAEKDGKVVDARILHGDLQPPYTGMMTGRKEYSGFGWGVTNDNLCCLPHFSEHVFRGEFPVAEVEYGEASFPGAAKLRAWSPFIPGNDVDSCLPAAFFEIEISNDTSDTLDYSAVGVLTNPFPAEKTVNTLVRENGRVQLVLSSGKDSGDLEYGDLSLGSLDDATSFQQYLYRGKWCDQREVYWHDLNTPGEFKNRTYPGLSEFPQQKDGGLIARHFTLKPGESRIVGFVITWNIPNRKNDWRGDIEELAAKNGVRNFWKNWYATRWADSKESGAYALENHDEMRRQTFMFRDSLFNSSLPEIVKEGVTANISILKSPTCLRLEDGTFYGWEGVGANFGSCEGSCTHVWNYAQALPFLFPSLERSMRTANYKYNVDAVGGSHFRINLPLGIKAEEDFARPCVDGQFGDVMKTYRDWKVSGDTEWLRRIWPALRKTVEYAWSDKNYDKWDPEKTGVITGRQHHTLDMELFGPSAWLNAHYLGALKAAAEMADVMGEADFAQECREIFERGKKWTDENLFNGECYYQRVDLADDSSLDGFRRSEDDEPRPTYWSEEHGQLKYQIGQGCAIDMPLAQFYANLYGLGEILDPEKCRKNLESIYKYNFMKSMRGVVNVWRTFSLNDESGVMICTWPEGKEKPVIPIPYASETMHGFEWAFACQLVQNRMLDEGLEIANSICSRYDGKKRNPWNEIECGSNYARSMASYGLVNSFCGLSFDMTSGYLGFEPVTDGDCKYFWSLGGLWGEYERKGASVSLKLLGGSLELSRFKLGVCVSTVKHNGVECEARESNGVLDFVSPVRVVAGEELLFEVS